MIYFIFVSRAGTICSLISFMCPFPHIFGPQEFTKTGTLLVPESYSCIVQCIPRLSQSSSLLLRDSVHYVHHSHIDMLYVSRCSHLFQPTFPFLVSPSTWGKSWLYTTSQVAPNMWYLYDFVWMINNTFVFGWGRLPRSVTGALESSGFTFSLTRIL